MDDTLSDELRKEIFNAEISFFFRGEESKVPYLNVNNKSIMFRKNGIRYFLNNESGHVAYNNNNFWQLSRRQFLYAKKCILEMLDNFFKNILKFNYLYGDLYSFETCNEIRFNNSWFKKCNRYDFFCY